MDASRIVLSYQSDQEEFLHRVVACLDEAGIASIDGTKVPRSTLAAICGAYCCPRHIQVPAGYDWRRFYFPALSRAELYLPILSGGFVLSQACEDEATFAWDKRKVDRAPIRPVA